MEDPSVEIIDKQGTRYFPPITIVCILISIILFVGINLENPSDVVDIYRKWGAPNSFDLINSDYWGLVSSNFLHVDIIHLAFNLYWFWQFGKKIEYEESKFFYLVLITSTALVSSLSQLSFSDSTGIGLSGIVYGFFGFLFMRAKNSENYKSFIDKKTINLFIFWLILCIVLTKFDIWNVGNAAHIGGLVFGGLIGYLLNFNRRTQWSLGILFILFLNTLIVYSPFSTAYLSYKAYNYHLLNNVEEAINNYKKILKVDPDNLFAKENLKQLEVYKLEQKAYELHSNKKFDEAKELYQQILLKDNDNIWAKENLEQLTSN